MNICRGENDNANSNGGKFSGAATGKIRLVKKEKKKAEEDTVENRLATGSDGETADQKINYGVIRIKKEEEEKEEDEEEEIHNEDNKNDRGDYVPSGLCEQNRNTNVIDHSDWKWGKDNNINDYPFAKLWFRGAFLLTLLWLSFPPHEIHSAVDAAVSPGRNSLLSPRHLSELNSKQKRQHRSSPSCLEFHIINLDSDKERWESVVSELTSKGVRPKQIKRITAVYGKNLTTDELFTNTTFVARHFSTPGTIGCYLSHRSCWELTENGSKPYKLFLEDDVLVADNFQEKVAKILREIDEDCPETRNGNWDVIFLGALGCVHPEGKYGLNIIASVMSGGLRKPQRFLEGAPHCHVPLRPLGAHAYILSKRGASKLLKNCWRVSGHVDVVAWGLPDLKVVSVHPMLAHQNMGSVSTIGAITKGLETKLPKIIVDDYTGIVLEWVFNAPVLQLGPFLLTMGRAVTYLLGGYLVAALLYDKYPWLVVVHTIQFGILFVLTKATTMRFGK